MTSINIITRNNCKLNVNLSGNYTVALTGVTGPYNIVLLEKDKDYLMIETHIDTRLMDDGPRKEAINSYIAQVREKDITQEEKDEIIEIWNKKYQDIIANPKADYKPPDESTGFIDERTYEIKNYEYIQYTQIWLCKVKSDVLTTYSAENVVNLINEMFSTCLKQHEDWENLIDYIDSYNKFHFTNCDILECSDAFGYLLGIPTTGYTDYSETIPIFNGTPYLFIRCNKLNPQLRYCWQTDPKLKTMTPDEQYKAMYSSVQRILSISPNNNTINYPFNIGGGQITANGNDLTDVEFTITGMRGEEINFASDLLWTFELTPIPDEDFSNLPGLLPPEAQQEMAQAQAQEEGGEQPPDGQPQGEQAQPEQQPSEQQEPIVKPSSTGLMKTGLPRLQNIQ